jgi:hypothetical protein
MLESVGPLEGLLTGSKPLDEAPLRLPAIGGTGSNTIGDLDCELSPSHCRLALPPALLSRGCSSGLPKDMTTESDGVSETASRMSVNPVAYGAEKRV